MSDTLVSVGILIAIAWFAHSYSSNPINTVNITDTLPRHDTPDVRRWKHGGAQETSETRGGNHLRPVEWPEVSEVMG